MSSLFLGFISPGRLGEFSRALHIKNDYNVSSGTALSTVLADRFFDLSALLTLGIIAFSSINNLLEAIISKLGTSLIITLGTTMLITLTFLQLWKIKSIRNNHYLLKLSNHFNDLIKGLRKIGFKGVIISLFLTTCSYIILFVQSHILVVALGINISFLITCFTMSLGSLATLIPISFSGLGTRDASFIFYLSKHNIPSEQALALSFSIFFTFFIIGGSICFIFYLMKPLKFKNQYVVSSK